MQAQDVMKRAAASDGRCRRRAPTDELADVAAVLLDRGVRAVPVVQDRRLGGSSAVTTS